MGPPHPEITLSPPRSSKKLELSPASTMIDSSYFLPASTRSSAPRLMERKNVSLRTSYLCASDCSGNTFGEPFYSVDVLAYQAGGFVSGWPTTMYKAVESSIHIGVSLLMLDDDTPSRSNNRPCGTRFVRTCSCEWLWFCDILDCNGACSRSSATTK